MSFPGHEHDDPQRASTALSTAGFIQDVVVATSRLLHDEKPNPREIAALEDCRDLLKGMISTDAKPSRSGERRLAGANTVALLRKTRLSQPRESGDLSSIVSAIERLLNDERDEESLEQVGALREMFLAVAEANLADMTRHDPGHEVTDSWTGLIASSVS